MSYRENLHVNLRIYTGKPRPARICVQQTPAGRAQVLVPGPRRHRIGEGVCSAAVLYCGQGKGDRFPGRGAGVRRVQKQQRDKRQNSEGRLPWAGLYFGVP